ncbi:CDP-alcohol phosphatidyltransferase family protein [Vibrio fluvialis]|uniref:CDP-alcohol phosphatidyltransferase family protein n=1 Tax=Vibrio fluvialis TaxID=676 RepID=UPI001302D823|nr:CDP-alcohol phosphatidyltransferase family protein [Vibrio fluvialis]EKO3947196.1 CDP-alcohol phosphatidyltransferase family protein [Vibrio fluvialis]MCE7608346.1 CDP-alcohol phosphatidyltransferase family protein [Vibrio fluvialis]
MNTPIPDEANRRPLAVRELKLTKRIAIWLSQKNVTPNQISLLSILFALAGFVSLLLYHFYPAASLLLLAAASIQLRLLCNLFDGMVAVEGGKKTPAGELFNDVPDRIADPLFIVAAGFATQSLVGMDLAWICAILAVLTAYVRVLGVSMNGPADFCGPMAKQHRMALLTASLLILCVYQWLQLPLHFLGYTLDCALALMLCGLVITTWRRLEHIYHYHQAQFAQQQETQRDV